MLPLMCDGGLAGSCASAAGICSRKYVTSVFFMLQQKRTQVLTNTDSHRHIQEELIPVTTQQMIQTRCFCFCFWVSSPIPRLLSLEWPGPNRARSPKQCTAMELMFSDSPAVTSRTSSSEATRNRDMALQNPGVETKAMDT